MTDIKELLGKTLTAFTCYRAKDQITFIDSEGNQYLMWHNQDCCESVEIYDICGDLMNLVGSPILQAEESSNREWPEGVESRPADSYTWTFYKLATIKGSVTIRWFGDSNGYYSESVDFKKVGSDHEA